MKDSFQFSGIPQMEEKFYRRSRPEIKFVLPSLYRAENAYCCHQQCLEKADTNELYRPQRLEHSFVDQATNFLYIKAIKPDQAVHQIYIESLT
uniref:Uncharacterized protein n=1 Tax=Arundo donax TaxID=35708 RepID=A0A0A9CXJ5_ARUDO